MDVAESLATDWNRLNESQELAVAEDFWPLCGLLQEEGLLLGSDERLANVRIVQFRVAHKSSENATHYFDDVYLPQTLAAIAGGELIHEALSCSFVA